MNNILINYGIRAGGVSYIWDEWSAYSSVSSGTTVTVGDPVEGAQEIQVQTRTRTGYTYSQVQTRTRTCTCSTVSGLHRNDVYGQYVTVSYQCYPRTYYSCQNGAVTWQDCVGYCDDGGGISACVNNPNGNFIECGPLTTETYSECQESSSGYYYYPSCSSQYVASCNSSYQLIRIECANTSSTSCNWSSYTGWSNVASCSASSPSCTNGAVQRQCQTVQLCAWNAYSEWSDTSSCTAATPACSNGALQRECQQRTRNAIEG